MSDVPANLSRGENERKKMKAWKSSVVLKIVENKRKISQKDIG